MATGGRAGGAAADHALVVGGGMAGLLGAWALAPHVRTVTVIERDALPEAPASRRGVPQGRHSHVLVQGGRDALDELGVGLDPGSGGTVRTDAARDLRWFQFGVWKTRFASGLHAEWCDRPRLEQALRTEVAGRAGIRLLPEHRAEGLLVTGGGRRVAGIRARRPGGRDLELEADLVVDASGGGSRLPRWLSQIGYPAVHEDRVTVDIGYASRVYRRSDDLFRDWTVLAIYPKPPESRRAGVLYPLDRERFLVTLVGWIGDHPPADEAGFLDFAASLPRPELRACLERAEPLGPIHRYGFPASCWRRFERMPRWPEGLIAVGDAVCRFNPVYGQGMTVGALDALTLARVLADAGGALPPGGARRLQKALARHRTTPWLLAAAFDFRFPGVAGPRPFGLAVLNAYAQAVLELAGTSDEANLRFLEVIGFRSPPRALFHPRIGWQVLRRVLRRPPAAP